MIPILICVAAIGVYLVVDWWAARMARRFVAWQLRDADSQKEPQS